jgi:hypothetical protein
MEKTTQESKSMIAPSCLEAVMRALSSNHVRIEIAGSTFGKAINDIMEELHAAAQQIAQMYCDARAERKEGERKFDPVFIATSRRSGGLRVEWKRRYPVVTKEERKAGVKPQVGFATIAKGKGHRYDLDHVRKFAPQNMWDKIAEAEDALAMIRREAREVMRLKMAVAQRVKQIMARTERLKENKVSK